MKRPATGVQSPMLEPPNNGGQNWKMTETGNVAGSRQ